MKFEEFEKYIDVVKNYHESDDKISKLLCTEGFIMYSSKAIGVILDLLKYIFNDEDEWIQYFIYELDFGERWTPESCFNFDDSVIKLKTTKDLYDFLIINGGNK